MLRLGIDIDGTITAQDTFVPLFERVRLVSPLHWKILRNMT